ncbi:MAG: HlyD family secretion protein [Bacteroidota bacterium]|nr:HlyD family secretion protein [Bacteroidota bacterium]
MKQRVKRILSESIIIAVILIGLIWVCSRFIHLGDVEYTDNAQIRQQIVPVNCRVQGFIKKINFSEYQTVHKGDTLVLIEDTEYKLRLAQSMADYQNALIGKSAMGTTITTTKNNLSVSDAAIEEARVLMVNAKNDFERYKNLLTKDAVTKQQYESMKASYEALKAKYDMLVKQKESTSLVKYEQTQHLDQQKANIAVAKAAVELAKLNLSYTVITAPCDGVVGRKNIQEGQLMDVGHTVVSIVDSKDKWIIANYKETQMQHIQEGMPVDIEIDAVPHVIFKGVVYSISDATGAQYSIIPQDNSAGNFVKVEQLIPVKINFAQGNSSADLKKLRAGMNVECRVKYNQHECSR